MSILGLLVALIIVLLAFWAARALLGAFGVGDPIATVVYVIIVVLTIFYLLGLLGTVSFPAMKLR